MHRLMEVSPASDDEQSGKCCGSGISRSLRLLEAFSQCTWKLGLGQRIKALSPSSNRSEVGQEELHGCSFTKLGSGEMFWNSGHFSIAIRTAADLEDGARGLVMEVRASLPFRSD